MAKKTISIGIMCYNEEPNIPLVYKALSQIANKEKKYNFEFIFVDNCSTDSSRNEIEKIAKIDKRITGIFLSRNFGPEASSQASLDHATGDAFILYEGDMQDPADKITDFIREWEKGFDVVVGVRTSSEEGIFMSSIRRTYYKIFRAISNIDIPVNAGSFGLLDKKAMLAIKNLPEKYRFYRGLRAWIGFKTAFVIYKRRKRQRGKSSYNFFSYLHHAERSFFGFSYLPLDIIVYLGLFLVILSFIWILTYIFSYFFFGQNIENSRLILFAVIFFGGINLLAISIIGKYVQVMVEETKARPVYIVEKILKK